MRVAFFVFSAAENTLGRAYALWLVTRELGWQTSIVAPEVNHPWAPVAAESEFVATLTADAEAAAAAADVLIALKPWPGSFDTALALGKKHGKPVVLDVDDPDWEDKYGAHRIPQLVRFVRKTLRGRPPLHAYKMRFQAARTPTLVSNPSLLRWYSHATVVPHARPARAAGAPHE